MTSSTSGQEVSLEGYLQFAIEIARKAGDHTLKYFNRKVIIDRKGDDSPVTQADREAEQILREAITTSFPNHSIIGEEFGEDHKEGDFTWILDPIDGTRSFIHGIPLYTTLIGLLYRGKPVAGVIYAPATNEMTEAATGLGCRYNGSDITVSNCQQLGNASMCTTDVYLFDEVGKKETHDALASEIDLHRTWGDAYGHMKVATGQIDLMVDPILNIWDAAALLPIITEAGGAFVDFEGVSRIDGGSGISANPYLIPQVMSIIQK